MPITLVPLSRRRFLAGSIAAAAAVLARQSLFGAVADADPNRFALLSDIHISADKTLKAHGVTMAEHLQQALAEVLQLEKPPACAIVNGDCAYLKGQAADYATVLDLLRPVREAGIPLHLTMGNHDQRDHFWQALPPDESRAKTLDDRQTLMFESPRADWIMLDSLDKTNATPGHLGAGQLKWLAETLDRRTSKPAIVLVHHNPQSSPASETPATTPPAEKPRISGLTDTRELLDVLLPRRRVKALLYGHTHAWSVQQQDGLHLINLPAVAYVFNPFQPSGWVDAHLLENAMTVELRCLDPRHRWHGQKHDLQWRR